MLKYSNEQIKADYPFRIELHAHTSPASGCADLKPAEVIERFKNVGYDGTAITNHFFIDCIDCQGKQEHIDIFKRNYHEALDAGEKYGVKIYLGAELRFKNENDNDYLLYGFAEDELSDIYDTLNGTLEDFVKNYKKGSMLLVQAHPFRNGMVRMNPDLLDGMEGFNLHPKHNGKVSMSADYAFQHGKMMTVGTDYHHAGHEGFCATRTRILPQNTAELVEILKKEDFVIDIGGKIVL